MEDDEFDANAPGVGDIEAYQEYIFNSGRYGMYTNTYEDGDDDDDDDDDNDADSDNNDDNDVDDRYSGDREIILISDDEDGESNLILPNSLINTQTNTPVRSLVRVASSTQALSTTTTTTTTTIRPIALTTTYSSEECCICLTTIEWGGISLHHNNHIIHVHCFINFLTHSRQIIWSQMTFYFDCPLCRLPVQGSVMMNN